MAKTLYARRNQVQPRIDLILPFGGAAALRVCYISEYHDTKAILADMNEQSQQETLDIDKGQERGI